MNRLPSLALALAATLLPALAQAGPGLVLVANEKADSLTAIAPDTLQVVATLPTCARPRHLQRLPGGTRLLVVCGEAGRADVLDLATRQVVDSVAIGHDPEVLDVSPDGRLAYVSAEDDGALAVFDLAAHRQVGRVAVGPEPEGVKVSADGRRVYVTSEVAGAVYAIDTATLQVLKAIPVGKRPRRLAFADGGAQLWVTEEKSASVSVIDTARLEAVATIPFAVDGLGAESITPVGIVPTPDGHGAAVALGRADRVALVDVATQRVRALVPVGRRAWGLALGSDGTRLYVGGGLSDDLTVIDMAAATPLRTLAVGRMPNAVLVAD